MIGSYSTGDEPFLGGVENSSKRGSNKIVDYFGYDTVIGVGNGDGSSIFNF